MQVRSDTPVHTQPGQILARGVCRHMITHGLAPLGNRGFSGFTPLDISIRCDRLKLIFQRINAIENISFSLAEGDVMGRVRLRVR